MKDIGITWLDECDSTSRVLKERVKHSYREPLALAAFRQTAGTGRLGRTWQSFPGNLHLSIALPAAEIQLDVRDILPLAVAVLVRRWIERYVFVRPCLKWPNDVLLDGRKVAGILCEGSIQGQEFLGVVIGIGVNLREAPDLNAGDSMDQRSYPAGSLADLTGIVLSPESAADTLLRMFKQDWPKLTRATIFAEWSNMAIRPGQHWLSTESGSPGYFRDEGLTEQGHLRLAKRVVGSEPVAEGVFVSSVSHEYIWSGQAGQPFLVADVGNSRAKIALAEISNDGDIRVPGDIRDFDYQELPEDFIQSALSAGAFPVIHAVSVNPAGMALISESAARCGLELRQVQRCPVRVTKSNYDLSLIGADRLAIMEAALYRRSRNIGSLPVMCVSLGTATTVDLIALDGTHLGGYIIAGIQTALDALARRGAMLPKLDPQSETVARGQWPVTTEQAMIQGVMESTVAFLKSERERLAHYCRVAGDDVLVLLTGGFAGLIEESLDDKSVVLDPSLVLQGCAVLAANGR